MYIWKGNYQEPAGTSNPPVLAANPSAAPGQHTRTCQHAQLGCSSLPLHMQIHTGKLLPVYAHVLISISLAAIWSSYSVMNISSLFQKAAFTILSNFCLDGRLIF